MEAEESCHLGAFSSENWVGRTSLTDPDFLALEVGLIPFAASKRSTSKRDNKVLEAAWNKDGRGIETTFFFSHLAT